MADSKLLARIVGVLIENAMHAIPVERAPVVVISAVPVAAPRAGVVLAVDDNGPGFAAAAEGRALEPFFTTKEAGTGLGLALVRKYAEAHGGGVAIARSPVLGGARVEVFLPVWV